MNDRETEVKKRDWPLKLLALVCAVMLWFYAEAEKNPLTDMQFDIPVQYVNQAEDYVVDSPVSSVRVTVKGKEVELSGLRSDDFAAIVDLSDARTGTRDYKIEVTSSANVERFTWQPLKASLNIEKHLMFRRHIRCKEAQLYRLSFLDLYFYHVFFSKST